MKTEKLEYRLYGQVLLNWFTGKRGPEKVLMAVTLKVEQTFNVKEQQAEWYRVGGPREFTWTAKKPTYITRVAMRAPKFAEKWGKKEVNMPMTPPWKATEPRDTITILIPEKVLKVR